MLILLNWRKRRKRNRKEEKEDRREKGTGRGGWGGRRRWGQKEGGQHRAAQPGSDGATGAGAIPLMKMHISKRARI